MTFDLHHNNMVDTTNSHTPSIRSIRIKVSSLASSELSPFSTINNIIELNVGHPHTKYKIHQTFSSLEIIFTSLLQFDLR